ncbi:MAG TPA: hypothetical protein PLR39_06970 [Treponemataceae bacterium]|nr:hypothetical protein [Treponemataceae bacterium]
MKRSFVFLLFLVILLPPCFCKRTEPKKVPSIFVNGIEFRVVHFYNPENKTPQNGGIIEVYTISSNTKKDTIIVYTTEYSNTKEKDIQDVFITKMKLLNPTILQVTNEKKQVFLVNIEKYVQEAENEKMVR